MLWSASNKVEYDNLHVHYYHDNSWDNHHNHDTANNIDFYHNYGYEAFDDLNCDNNDPNTHNLNSTWVLRSVELLQ